MGRKKKSRGKLFTDHDGTKVRVVGTLLKRMPWTGKRGFRGKTGAAWQFTNVLKERAPLVYAFTVAELRKPKGNRDPGLQSIISEWQMEAAPRQRPSARELTAYVIERAFKGAWEVWKIKPPYSEGDHDAFFRRYVHGHPGALRVFRSVLSQPLPWHRHHVGYELRWFLDTPGQAAEYYKVLKLSPLRIPFMQIIVE